MNSEIPSNPNIYQDSRDDIEVMYGKKNPASDYGGRIVIGSTVEVSPVEKPEPYQSSLFGELVETTEVPASERPLTEQEKVVRRADIAQGRDPDADPEVLKAQRRASVEKQRAQERQRGIEAARYQPRRFK